MNTELIFLLFLLAYRNLLGFLGMAQTCVQRTEEEEVQYYVHWIHAVAFPSRLVLWIAACGCEGQPRCQGLTPLMRAMWLEVQKHYRHTAVMIDKCALACAEHGFPAGHGCKGPLLNVLAQMLHATLLQVPQDEEP